MFGNKSAGGHVHLAPGVDPAEGEQTDTGVSGSGVDVSAAQGIVDTGRAKADAKAIRRDERAIAKKKK